MAKRALIVGLPLTLFLLAACNLGQGVPGGAETPTPEILIPAQLPTNTPGGPPPTVTPGTTNPEVAQGIGPVTVTGDFRVGSTVSIRVKRGEAVSGVQCLTTNSQTNATSVLNPPTTSPQSLDGTFDEVFSFTPQQGGTFTVSCTGNALTLDQGLLEVEANSSPFTIEAKG